MPRPPDGSDDGVDLDALIGDLRQESARRRAAPGFPLDAEADIGMELDRLAPAPDRPRIERLSDTVGGMGSAHSARPGWWRSRRSRQEGSDELAVAVAEALRMVSDRFEDLERRVRRLEVERDSPSFGVSDSPLLPGAGGPGGDVDLFPWAGVIASSGLAPSGRSLCAGPGAARWVTALAEAGWDVYGVEPGAGGFDDGAVRGGELLEHLAGIPGRALALAVVVSPHDIVPPGQLAFLSAELARVARQVKVVSEAQWAWARRVGAEEADLCARRPLTADTWIALMQRVGFASTGSFSSEGTSYAIEARLAP
jgi:hypothetical protein